ncbi:MAG: hypothetical protein ACR2JI_05420 [Mycobacterium sp.]
MIGGNITSLTIRPVAAAGIATVLTAAMIAGGGVQQAHISVPDLRIEMGAVQLQALTTSAIPATAAVTTGAVSPSAAATAAATDPVQILTDAVKSAVTAIASALWFAAFPITLPLSVIGGFVSSLAANMSGSQAPAAADPLIGVTFFFSAPNILLTSGFANIGLSSTWNQHQLGPYSPFMAAATPRSAAARKPAADATSARPTAARSVKPAATGSREAAKTAKRSAARSRHSR